MRAQSEGLLVLVVAIAGFGAFAFVQRRLRLQLLRSFLTIHESEAIKGIDISPIDSFDDSYREIRCMESVRCAFL